MGWIKIRQVAEGKCIQLPEAPGVETPGGGGHSRRDGQSGQRAHGMQKSNRGSNQQEAKRHAAHRETQPFFLDSSDRCIHYSFSPPGAGSCPPHPSGAAAAACRWRCSPRCPVAVPSPQPSPPCPAVQRGTPGARGDSVRGDGVTGDAGSTC